MSKPRDPTFPYDESDTFHQRAARLDFLYEFRAHLIKELTTTQNEIEELQGYEST